MFHKFTTLNNAHIFQNLDSEEMSDKVKDGFQTPGSIEDVLMKLLNLEITDVNLQHSCITLIAKLKSRNALRLRKLEKAYFVPGENNYMSAKILAGMTNATAFDFRCNPGTSYGFEDSDNIGIPELTQQDFKSSYSGCDIVACTLAIKGFVYMTYYINNVYDNLVKRYDGKLYRHFDPSSQGMSRTLKIYDTLMWILLRYDQCLYATNLDAFVDKEGVARLKKLQEPTFTKIFDCLKAMTYKNEKMQKVLWKYREFFVLEKRALSRQFGELDLLNYILDNDELLHQANNLDSLALKVLTRMSKENFPIVIQILSKISISMTNSTISLLANDFLTNGDINEAMGNIYNYPPEVFCSFVVMLINIIKSNRTLVFRNTVIKKFTFSLLLEKVISIPQHIVNLLEERFSNKSQVDPNQADKPSVKFEQEGFDFEFKYLDDVFEANTQEYIENCHKYLHSLFELYDLLYFSMFVGSVTHADLLDGLLHNFLDPMSNHLIHKDNQNHENEIKLISKHLPYFVENVVSYITLILERKMITSDETKFKTKMCMSKVTGISTMAEKQIKNPVLKLSSGDTFEINTDLPNHIIEYIPDSKFRVPNDSAVQSTFYREIKFPGEDRFWMENLGFLERKKQALEAYRSTYDQKYDIPYQKEFYSVMNFTNIWQNSCNLLTS